MDTFGSAFILLAAEDGGGSGVAMTIVTVLSGIVGLVVGYVIGFRSGKVAGELEALKSSMRHDSRGRRRSRSIGGAGTQDRDDGAEEPVGQEY